MNKLLKIFWGQIVVFIVILVTVTVPAVRERIGVGDEPVFFIIAVIILPLAFIIGSIGVIWQLIAKTKEVKTK